MKRVFGKLSDPVNGCGYSAAFHGQGSYGSTAGAPRQLRDGLAQRSVSAAPDSGFPLGKEGYPYGKKG